MNSAVFGLPRRILLITACFALLLAGCLGSFLGDAVPEEAEQAFQLQSPIHEKNSQLELEVVEERPQGSRIIDLLLMNRSDVSIAFPPGYGARIFVLDAQGNSWREIPNGATYHGHGDILEPKQSGLSNWVALVSIAPSQEQLQGASILRVTIQGKVIRNGQVTEEVIGTYATLEIDPATGKVRQIDR